MNISRPAHEADVRHVLPAAAILGAGAITHPGRGLDAIAAQLSHENSLTPTQPAVSPGVTPKAVDDALLFDPKLDRKLRRADRFVRMSCMAAMDAWEQALPHMGDFAPDRVGMIVSSGFGPHQRGFRFLDGLLEHGDMAASPTDFSHSVHGSASAYIAGLLELRGPTFSITDFQAGFAQAVLLAQCWLDQSRCDHVLVGATEELGAVMLAVAQQCLPASVHYDSGEGAFFVMLSKVNHANAIAQLSAQLGGAPLPVHVDLLLGQNNVYLPRSSTIPPGLSFGKQSSFLASLGHSASALAFETLGGLLAMRDPKLPICHDNQRQAPVGVIDSALAYVSLSDTQTASLLLSRGA